jgi:hypothetical protein
MIKILSQGDGKHRIENASDDCVGWINGRTIGFRGFVTEHHAREAAVAARRALDRTIQSQHPGWQPRVVDVERIHAVHDGAYEWLFDGASAVARLLRPHRRAYDASFGIELILPSFASEALVVTAAHGLCLAVEPYRDALGTPNGAIGHGRPTVLRDGGAAETSTFY